MKKNQCGFCGKSLESKRSGAKFCSTTCRVKNHKQKQEPLELVQVDQKVEPEIDFQQRDSLKREIFDLRRQTDAYLRRWDDANKEVKRTQAFMHRIKERIKLADLSISILEEKRVRLQLKIASTQEEIRLLDAKPVEELSSGIRPNRKFDNWRLRDLITETESAIERLLSDLDKKKKEHVRHKSDLEQENTWLEKTREERMQLDSLYKSTLDKIERLQKQLNRPVKTTTIPVYSSPPQPRLQQQDHSADVEVIGAGDLQGINFETFRLSGELGAFLGELDRNKTCFALTGDSGAGKSYFSFEIARLFITDLNFRVKYFSLEEGVGKLTQEKVAQFELGNEMHLTAKGSLEDVRIAAKTYPLVIVDSFNSLGAKAEEFERLRTDFPQTIFLLIFQKTTAGTIRGGSAIKYNSSATIDVIKRDGERIAIMEKGRYGTIGWEYSILEKCVINKGDRF